MAMSNQDSINLPEGLWEDLLTKVWAAIDE
jgi:hypothetical protein